MSLKAKGHFSASKDIPDLSMISLVWIIIIIIFWLHNIGRPKRRTKLIYIYILFIGYLFVF